MNIGEYNLPQMLLGKYLPTLTEITWNSCVAWRFCRTGYTSGEAAKFARKVRESERQSHEKNKNHLPGFDGFLTAAPFTSF